eukprot:Skav208986  [mRNA]  locus=scaffold395:9431:11834:- [translate_table: standard]
MWIGGYTARSSVTSSALLLEVEEESAEADVKEFDAMWWEIRQELDGYLQASQEYVTATQTAAGMLRDYSAMCTSGFAELKRAYTLSARAETRAHKILKSAWAAVSTGIGEMASKVVDGAILDHLALHDLRSLNPKQMLSTLNGTDEFCFGDVEAAFVLVESATKAALKDGVFGQTHRQLMVLFEEPCHKTFLVPLQSGPATFYCYQMFSGSIGIFWVSQLRTPRDHRIAMPCWICIPVTSNSVTSIGMPERFDVLKLEMQWLVLERCSPDQNTFLDLGLPFSWFFVSGF